MVVVGYVGYNCYERDGLGFRLKGRQDYSEYFENSLPEQRYFKKLGIIEKYRFECDFYDHLNYRIGHSTNIPIREIGRNCFERNRDYRNAVLIWGDSHAAQLHFGLKNNLPSSWQILQVASSGCSPSVNVSEPSSTNYCDQSNWFALKTISEIKPNVVIVSQNLDHSTVSFGQIAEKLKSFGIEKIIFTGPTPHWTTDLPKIILTKLWLNTPRRTYAGIDQKVLKENKALQEAFKQTETEKFVNLIDCFCNQDGCLTRIGDDKKAEITTWDYGHLTPIASDYLAKELLVKLVIGNTGESLDSANPPSGASLRR
jgi:hypothetical protein